MTPRERALAALDQIFTLIEIDGPYDEVDRIGWARAIREFDLGNIETHLRDLDSALEDFHDEVHGTWQSRSEAKRT